MYVCLLRDVHTSILKMADFSPVHCLFLHLWSSNHISFRSAGHFALSNQTIGIQILWTTFVLKYCVSHWSKINIYCAKNKYRYFMRSLSPTFYHKQMKTTMIRRNIKSCEGFLIIHRYCFNLAKCNEKFYSFLSSSHIFVSWCFTIYSVYVLAVGSQGWTFNKAANQVYNIG